MTSSDKVPPLQPSSADDRRFFGHPRGLSVLFFSEMWERFSYYGMRALLMLFMVAKTSDGGLGWSTAKAGVVYGVYTAMVYLVAVPGGWIADKFVGLRRAVLWGGVLIMAGHIALALPATATFYLGLGLVVLGTGLLKPNISTIVGQLYAKDDPRRDSGFSIYYMGINLGAFLAPLACGFLAQNDSFRAFLTDMGIDPNSSWHFGFGCAAVGMGLGLVQYMAGWKALGEAGLHPNRAATEAEARRNKTILGSILASLVVLPIGMVLLDRAGVVSLGSLFAILLYGVAVATFVILFALGKWSGDERRRLVLVMLLFAGAVVFWTVFEQAGSTMNLFADKNTRLSLFGLQLEASYFQSVNSIFVIALAPVFGWLWLKLGKREPSSPAKFGIGMVFLAAGILLMVPAAKLSQSGQVSPMWLVGLYFLHTCGELCLSPVGLSSMTRLAPSSIGGMVMGIWFLGGAVGNYNAGRLGGMYGSIALDRLFLYQVSIPIVAAAVFFALVKPIARMLAKQG